MDGPFGPFSPLGPGDSLLRQGGVDLCPIPVLPVLLETEPSRHSSKSLGSGSGGESLGPGWVPLGRGPHLRARAQARVPALPRAPASQPNSLACSCAYGTRPNTTGTSKGERGAPLRDDAHKSPAQEMTVAVLVTAMTRTALPMEGFPWTLKIRRNDAWHITALSLCVTRPSQHPLGPPSSAVRQAGRCPLPTSN